MLYELLTDIKNVAKRGSLIHLDKKLSEEDIKELTKIGVVKKIGTDITKETIVKEESSKKVKERKDAIKNIVENKNINALKEEAKSLGIEVKGNWGLNKLTFMIDEAKKKEESSEKKDKDNITKDLDQDNISVIIGADNDSNN